MGFVLQSIISCKLMSNKELYTFTYYIPFYLVVLILLCRNSLQSFKEIQDFLCFTTKKHIYLRSYLDPDWSGLDILCICASVTSIYIHLVHILDLKVKWNHSRFCFTIKWLMFTFIPSSRVIEIEVCYIFLLIWHPYPYIYSIF